MTFRILVFVFLITAGYFNARRMRGNRFTLTLVSLLLIGVIVAFSFLGKKLFAMFGFSMYLMLIVLGFAAGILAGLTRKQKQLEGQKPMPAAANRDPDSD